MVPSVLSASALSTSSTPRHVHHPEVAVGVQQVGFAEAAAFVGGSTEHLQAEGAGGGFSLVRVSVVAADIGSHSTGRLDGQEGVERGGGAGVQGTCQTP